MRGEVKLMAKAIGHRLQDTNRLSRDLRSDSITRKNNKVGFQETDREMKEGREAS